MKTNENNFFWRWEPNFKGKLASTQTKMTSAQLQIDFRSNEKRFSVELSGYHFYSINFLLKGKLYY